MCAPARTAALLEVERDIQRYACTGGEKRLTRGDAARADTREEFDNSAARRAIAGRGVRDAKFQAVAARRMHHRIAFYGLSWSTIASEPGAQSFLPSAIMTLPAGQETTFSRVWRTVGEGWGQQVTWGQSPRGGTVSVLTSPPRPRRRLTRINAMTAHAINARLRKAPDERERFACVTQIGSVSSVLIALPSFPAKSVPELIALAKAQPGKIVYATGPIGTTNHILGEALRIAAGIDIGHVPYKGGGPAIQDLLAGRVPLVGTVVLEVLPFVRSGK